MRLRRALIAAATIAPLLATASGAGALEASPSTFVWDGKVDATGAAPANTNWTTGANWAGDTAPAPGAILNFPNNAAGRLATNDFPAGTQFSELRISVAGLGATDYTIQGNGITVLDLLETTGLSNEINLPITLGNSIDFRVQGELTVNGTVNTNGKTLTFKGGPNEGGVDFRGGIIGSGGLVLDETAPRVVLRGEDTNTFTGGVHVKGGEFTFLEAFGTMPGPIVIDGGVASVSGVTNHSVTATANGGVFNTRVSTPVWINGSLTLNDMVSFEGPGYASVRDTVTLNDAWLGVSTAWCGHCQSYGLQHQLVVNDGTDPVVGTFYDLPEGARFEESGAYFEITYVGGDGNDVLLRVVDSLEPPPPPPPPPPPRSGYWMVGADGNVYAFGDAQYLGSAGGRLVPNETAVDIEPTPDFNGYWILANSGRVFAYGSATKQSGGPTSFPLPNGERFTSISARPGGGYWTFTDRGRVFAHGSAPHKGDMAGKPLNGPVLGSVATPTGDGYFMVASDGGIFAFGDAKFRGSMGGQPLNGTVVGLAPDPDESGYWLVAKDGGIFAFEAGFNGSMGGKPLNKPVVGMVPYGNGYLMVASDGGIFAFSSKPFAGSLGSNPPLLPVTGVAPVE
jgi:hypothetical protein